MYNKGDMTLEDALAQLKAQGDEKVRTRNRKNGAGDNQFGVAMGDIRKLAAKIKTDHALAMELWDTGNIDARLLAVLVLAPKHLSRDVVDRLVRDADFPQLADWLNAYVVKDHPDRESLRQAWMEDDNPWAARAGWNLTAGRIAKKPEGLDLVALLDRIESEMPEAAAPAQWTMNNCLAGIGIHHPKLRTRALAIGERLGIYRDYPVSKGCTSPFAPIWINEMVRRREREDAVPQRRGVPVSRRIDRASRIIAAPAATIYQAFANADAFMTWLPPEGMRGQVFGFEFREGGGYRMRLSLTAPGHGPGKTSDDADDVNVRFVTVVPDARIEQDVTFDSKDPRFAGVMKMTWSFQPVAEGTDVTVEASNVPHGITPEDHHAGLTSTLENLARFVEQED